MKCSTKTPVFALFTEPWIAREDANRIVESACRKDGANEGTLRSLLGSAELYAEQSGRSVKLPIIFSKCLNATVLTCRLWCRYFVALSLAEAETIRRIMHLREQKEVAPLPHSKLHRYTRSLRICVSYNLYTLASFSGVIETSIPAWHEHKLTQDTCIARLSMGARRACRCT
jgi:hypothetical protein